MSTTRYAALLRGVNLGSKRRVSMAALRETIEELGFTDVATLLQSGNAVFSAPGTTPAALEPLLEQTLRAAFGIEIAVLVRTRDELAKISRDNPFPEAARDGTKLHVVFLRKPPPVAARRAIEERDVTPDQLEVRGREVYVSCPNGMRDSRAFKLSFDKALGEDMSARNWNTVVKLVALTT